MTTQRDLEYLNPQMSSTLHSYPEQLATFARERWASVSPKKSTKGLPDEEKLARFLSVCYQASMMREEERPVDFRVMLISPKWLPEDGGPPTGLQRLSLSESRAFNEDELRRLSPATDYHRSLIGVEMNEDGEFRIWGIVQSGPRWVTRMQGGRAFSPSLPPVPVVHAIAPGRIKLCCGSEFVAKLDGGELRGDIGIDIFAARWLGESFSPVRAEIARLHAAARSRAKETWPPLDKDLTAKIGQHAIRRMISVLREAHHGGTLLIVPLESTQEFSDDNTYVNYKYRFHDDLPRRRYQRLFVGVTNRLVEIHGRGEASQYSTAVGWKEYQKTTDREISNLDEAIFEFANMVADLASVDGAVVMSKRMELLGFGAEISAGLEKVGTVRRAVDLEGDEAVEEPVDGVGTRHRSAYRFVKALPGAMAIVVSQDGSVRFITCKDDDMVTYWHHA